MPSFHNLSRRSFGDTPPEECLDRSADAAKVLAIVEETIALAPDRNQRSRSKRLILIEGDAGIGKTWFMDYLQERLRTEHPDWKLAPFFTRSNDKSSSNQHSAYRAEPFVDMEGNPYQQAIEVLVRCDEVLETNCFDPSPTETRQTVEDLEAWSSHLHDALGQKDSTPLILFFDELEWWVGVKDDQKDVLNHLFRLVWQMLLRHAQLPCIIICASRRQPQFSNPLLRLVLSTYELNGFSSSELTKLTPNNYRRLIDPYIEKSGQSNPWVTQLIAATLDAIPDALQDGKLTSDARWKIFQGVVDGRLDDDLQKILFDLAEQRPGGFMAEDTLLPESYTTLKNLIDASFIRFERPRKRYFVAKVLSSLFTVLKE